MPDSSDPSAVSNTVRGPQRAGRASKIEDSKWEEHKDTIKKLYIDENMRLDDLAKHMEKEYKFKARQVHSSDSKIINHMVADCVGFCSSDQQYRIQFAKWDLRKNRRKNEKRPASPGLDQPRRIMGPPSYNGPLDSLQSHRSTQQNIDGTNIDSSMQFNTLLSQPLDLDNSDNAIPSTFDPIFSASDFSFGTGPWSPTLHPWLPVQPSPISHQNSHGTSFPMAIPYNSHATSFPMGMSYNLGQPSQAYYHKEKSPGHERVNIIDTVSRRQSQLRQFRGSSTGRSTMKRQAIHQAVQAGSLNAVKLLLSVDPKCAHSHTTEGINTVWIAAQGGHANIMGLLINQQVDVNAPAIESRRTPIHQAAQNGHLKVVELLLEHGATADPVDSDHITPLWSAAQEGHYDIVKLLLENDVAIEVESSDAARRPIHQAAQCGHLRIVELLLSYGAAPDPTDNSGITPLWSAAQQGHTKIVRRLLEADARVDVTSYDGSRQPIHQAAQNGHLETVQVLLDYGAKATPEEDSFDDTTPSPFWLACGSTNGNTDIVKLFLQHGADVNFSVASSGKKPLHAAAYRGHVNIARLLIERGCNVDAKEDDGWTALMLASQEGHLPLLNLLIEKSANVNAEEKDGATSLWIASQQGHTAIVRRLLELEAKQLPTRSAQRRPIHQAAQNGHLSVLQMLLKAAPEDINAEDKNGATPLLLAAQENQPRYLAIMNHLISMGAKASV
ncbi:hypothetical protein DTO271G3_3308 [Paecilomyces variotii]|nr:hypothetical protein DTO271G3_3308 [Paecilomyces variotii]